LDEKMSERKKQPFVSIHDISENCRGKRVIVIGDIHGMFDELQQLLAKCAFDSSKDVLIFTGDLIDRGPKIKETLEFARNTPNVYTVLSNHDDKLLRYLRGSKVSIGSMKETIAQCKEYLDDSLKAWLESLPVIIKFDSNKYVLHAGINPNFPITQQKKEFCLFARHFNPTKNNFSDMSSKMWWEYDNVGGEIVFFGHQPMDKINAGKHFALDGGCVFGETLRAWTSEGEVFEVQASQSYEDLSVYNQFVENPLLVEDDYVKKGLLSRKELTDVVLYNYTQKCTYDNAWDDVTMRNRGTVYDKITCEVVSYTPKKFFNLNENEFSQLNKLPLHLKYEVYEKVDGSMITCSWHRGRWIVATRGSFESDQAKEARKIIFDERNYDLNKNYSYIFEVIYPENRVSPGARLVCDYGDTRNVVLLIAYDKKAEGRELTRSELESEAKRLDMPICKKYEITLDDAVKNQKTLPFNEEGYVILFEDGTRVKVKGDEYVKMQKIINGLSPLSIWEAFDSFDFPHEHLAELPEEIRPEAEEIAKKIHQKMDLALFELKSYMLTKVPEVDKSKEDWRKTLGLWLKNNSVDNSYKSLVFPWVLGDNKTIFKHIKEKARPTGNALE
jgi:RNA ligase